MGRSISAVSYEIIVYLKMKEVDNMDIAKEEARRLIDKLPDQATWDDIIYEFYVKKKLDVALKAAEEGHVVSHEEAKRRLHS